MATPAERLRFDPAEAIVIREPKGTGYGHWVGGHKASYDPATGDFVLFYRERTPLEHGRGGRAVVARSRNGIEFDDVWEATKEELNANSIEVGHCLRHDESEWRLYVSYEVAGTSTWRIDVLRGPDPADLDAQARRTVLSPGDYGLTWIKDPWVVKVGGGYELFAAAPPRTGPQRMGNVISAAPLDATVVAASDDGLYFPTIEYVFEATGDDTWHGRRARLNSLIAWEKGWLATWDGGRTFFDNYEEWTGLATSPDRRRFDRIDTGGPWIRSPFGSVRYVYALRVDTAVFLYFEYTRKDLSHDLRVVKLDGTGP